MYPVTIYCVICKNLTELRSVHYLADGTLRFTGWCEKCGKMRMWSVEAETLRVWASARENVLTEKDKELLHDLRISFDEPPET